ncbi:MAG: GAF domain-containing protein [Planctomycetota bacterium]|nr:GAF domain-containing protein [Planctomycetota bacterium]
MTWQPVNAQELSKDQAYDLAYSALQALLKDKRPDEVAFMATLSSLLKTLLKTAFWVGFYRKVDGERLVVGPYQGTPGCLEIKVGMGVCGKAAQTGEDVIVDDVHEFPGHIACDERSRSEVVLPVFVDGDVHAVLDLDSDEPGSFDETDVRRLREMLELYWPCNT